MRAFYLTLFVILSTVITLQDSEAQKASAAPAYLKATITAPGQVTITWGETRYWEQGIPGGYSIYSKAPASRYYTFSAVVSPNTHSFVVNYLTPGKWIFRVASFGGTNGREGGSREVTAIIP